MLSPKAGPEMKRNGKWMKAKCMRFPKSLVWVTWREKIPNVIVTKEFGVVHGADSVKM